MELRLPEEVIYVTLPYSAHSISRAFNIPSELATVKAKYGGDYIILCYRRDYSLPDKEDSVAYRISDLSKKEVKELFSEKVMLYHGV